MPLPATGYSAKRLADWQSDLRAAFRASLNTVTAGLGDSVNLDAGSVLGNLLDTVAARLDELAEASQDLYDSFDERSSTGTFLENLARLVGISGKLPPLQSTVTLRLTATAACTVPAGSIVADVAGQQWATQTAVVFGAPGTANVEGRPSEYGPIPAAAGTLAVIVTPVTNWSAVTNLADATPGRLRETDPQLRSRRRQSLQIAGAASPDAIRAHILDIDGIEACLVVSNRSSSTVVLGSTTTITLPPNTLAVIVAPNGLAAAVADAVAESIWDYAPAGIDSVRMVAADAGAGGGYTETVLDDTGSSQTVRFSAVVDRPMTFTVTVVDGPIPASNADIRQVFIDYIDSLGVGDQPVALPLYGGLDDLDGILNVTALGIVGTVDSFEKAIISNPAADIVITHI